MWPPNYPTALRAIKAAAAPAVSWAPRLREPRRPCLSRALQPVALAIVELPADVLEERPGEVEVVGEVGVDGRLHQEVRCGARVPVRDRGAERERRRRVEQGEPLGRCACEPGGV